MLKVCPECGVEFIIGENRNSASHHIYCSEKCSQKAWYYRDIEKVRRRKREYAKERAIVDDTWRRERNRKSLQRYRSDPRRMLLSLARQRALTKGIEFCLTVDDIHIPDICPLLEIPIFSSCLSDNSPTLDRINNLVGYIPGNVWVISMKANRAKNNLSLREHELLVLNWRKYEDERESTKDE